MYKKYNKKNFKINSTKKKTKKKLPNKSQKGYKKFHKTKHFKKMISFQTLYFNMFKILKQLKNNKKYRRKIYSNKKFKIID